MCYRDNGRSGGTPLIAVVESADLRKLDNLAIRRSLDGSLPWGVFAEAQVGSGSVVVDEVSGEKGVKKSIETRSLAWLLRKTRQLGEGGLQRLGM